MTTTDLTRAEKDLRNFRRDLAAATADGDQMDATRCRLAIERQEAMVARMRDTLSRARQAGESQCPADVETDKEECE